MESDLWSLDASLQLLDDVNDFDLVHLECNEGQEVVEVPNEPSDDEGREILQHLELIGDLGEDLPTLIPSLDVALDPEHADSSAIATLPRQEKPMEAQKSTRKFRHQRKKQELEYVRKQVWDLEKELEDLKTFRVVGAESQRAELLLLEGGESRKDVSLWERVARNQRSERVKAEVENGKLRQRLEGQLKLAQGLQKLLRKRPADEDMEGEANQKMRARNLSTLLEPQIFEILNGQVDGLYSRVDAVMNEAGLAAQKCECNGAQVKFDEFGKVCVEMVDAKISPFAMHDVAKAAWTMLGTKRIELESGYYKALECTHDTVRAEYCVMLRLRREEALVRMQILGRRVVEEERVVMVWATFGQTEGAPFDKQRINLSERGWTVVESLKDERSSDGGGTITRCCLRLTPELDDEPGQVLRAGLLSDLVIGSYELNMQTLHQEVENCLLQAQ